MPSLRLSILFLLCAVTLLPAAARADSPGQNVEKFTAELDFVLKQVVHPTGVDYAAVKGNVADSLSLYLKLAAEIRLDDLNPQEKLAFTINLYNATMLAAVNEKVAGKADWKPSDDDYAVFKEPRVKMASGAISLNDLENNIIRKMGDARIHAAINCAAMSCPPLIPRAYRVADLDATLTQNVKTWLADPSRNTIDHAGKTLKLSRIFDWFNADFGGKEKVSAWVTEFTDRDVSGYKVEFVEYDWNLNRKR